MKERWSAVGTKAPIDGLLQLLGGAEKNQGGSIQAPDMPTPPAPPLGDGNLVLIQVLDGETMGKYGVYAWDRIAWAVGNSRLANRYAHCLGVNVDRGLRRREFQVGRWWFQETLGSRRVIWR